MPFLLKDMKNNALLDAQDAAVSDRAYLFEFLNKQGLTESSFTFSLPPESEDISLSFRKAETKTFSGTHIDDYGTDADHIVLSGNTAGRLLRFVKVDGVPLTMTGEQEIYYFRELLLEYKNYKDNGENLANGILLTDLSKTFQNGFYQKNKYRVYPNEFKITRDKSRPFVYNYSIDMTAVPYNKLQLNLSNNKIEKIESKFNIVREKCAEINKKFDEVTEKLAGFYDSILEKVENARLMVQAVMSVAEKSIGLITGAMNLTSDALVDLSGEVFAIPQDIMGSFYNIADETMNAVANMIYAIDQVKEHFVSFGTKEYWFPETVKKKLDADIVEVDLLLRKIAGNLDDDSNEVYTSVLDINSDISVYAETHVGGEGQSVTVNNAVYYGSYSYAVRQNDTLESICMAYYGNLSRLQDILIYNGITDIGELPAGTEIYLPNVNPSAKHVDGIVSYQKNVRDNYGRDIRLDVDGYIMARENDFDVTGGVDNLTQAVLLRLRDSAERRLRLNVYGIRANLGAGRAAVNYILSSIFDTVSDDPRVLRVNEITFKGAGDYLEVTVKYTDINNSAMQLTQRV